jgi:hypothetical protein
MIWQQKPKSQHPLYDTWRWFKSRTKIGLVNEWKDFWTFASAIGDRPLNHTLRKINPEKPLGPGNWQWKLSVQSKHKAEYAKKWRKLNPRKNKSNHLKTRYNITLNDYERLYKSQNGKCAICKCPETNMQKLSIDHCHTSTNIRALLCRKCNTGLGAFNDNVEYLNAAIEYLKKHEC